MDGVSFATAPGRNASGDLDALRDRLDRIDQHLLETLRARLECCVQIAQVKRRHAVPMMQPQRIDAVQARAARYARAHRIDATFLRRLYDLIIAETCRVEDVVIAASPAAGGDLTSSPGS